MPPTAFDEISKSSNDPLKAQGVIVDKRETVPYNDAKALLFTGHQRDGDTTLRKWIFVAPADGFTAVVSVQAPDSAGSPDFDKAIRASLVSTATRPDVPIAEQLETLPFRIADTGGFRPVRVAPPATEVLTKGDKDTFENNAQPLLIVSAAPGAPDSAEARANLASNLFTGFTGLKEIRITGADMIRMQGMQIHQIMADAKNEATGDEVKVVQWLRFGGGNAFIRLVGIARRDDWLPAFSAMRTARDSIGPPGSSGDRG
jgi:hypothetical protein